MDPVSTTNEDFAALAFSNQSAIFDEIYTNNTIIGYKRGRVRQHVLKYLSSGSSILELNAGTGEDAIFFAQRGFKVHATDIAEGMQHALAQKVLEQGLRDKVSQERCSYTQLRFLKEKGPYDLIFSNFAGLNCTAELTKVLDSFFDLLKPGGMVTLVMLPKFCLWETLLLFKGKFSTAMRRFFSHKGRAAHVEGVHFNCWYYNPSFIKKHLKNKFEVISEEGLCTIVPPSYIEGFAEKYPKTYRLLTKTENKWKSAWPWKYIGDYYILSLKKI